MVKEKIIELFGGFFLFPWYARHLKEEIHMYWREQMAGQ